MGKCWGFYISCFFAVLGGFWKVENGNITNNWVMVDFPHVLAQLGVDVFNGHGWEAYDRGEKTPPSPTTKTGKD